MDSDPERSRAAADDADVPQHLANALDQSAEDLRCGRVEDARVAVARLQHKLDGHLARKQAAPAKG